MSNKYVPSFLKNQPTTTNRFEALSDDFPMRKEKPLINTSLPAKEAPKLIPATLASLTSNNGLNSAVNNGSKRTFASKFAEEIKNISDPNYKAPLKTVDVTSENEFPSLGAPTKSVGGAWGSKPKNQIVEPEPTLSFANKAKEWAKQKEEEENEARKKAIEEEKLRRENEIHKRMNIVNVNRYTRQYPSDDEDDEYVNEDSSLGDDSYEVPEYDEEPSEEEEDEENDEFNQNIGWDGRRKGDLY